MDSSELRVACEMAGATIVDGDWPCAVLHGRTYRLDPTCESLLPVVADVLVAKVRKMVGGWAAYMLRFNTAIDAALATAEQRIRAAVSVLENKL